MRAPKKILQDAQQCLTGGVGALETLPVIIKRILREETWTHLANKEGEPFANFQAFVEYKLWWGLETKYDRLVEFCKDDEDCYRMLLEQVPAAKRDGERGPAKSADNIRPSYGTSASHTLKRLKRDNPELANKVIAGQLSANAAAIEAGFRKKTITICQDSESAAASIRRNFGDDFANQLKEEL